MTAADDADASAADVDDAIAADAIAVAISDRQGESHL